MRALVAWLRLRPKNALTASIISWMEVEAPDLGEPGEENSATCSGAGAEVKIAAIWSSKVI
jgi:hypothetical protein